MSGSRSTGNTAPGLTSVLALFTTWSFITYIIRCWVKRRRSDIWGIDDTLISIAFVAVIFHVFTVCRAITHGYGNQWYAISDDDQDAIEKMLYASQILYYFALGMTKTSIGFFNVRLTLHKWHCRLTQALVVLTIIWTICAVLLISIRGDLTSPWTVDGAIVLWQRWLGIEVAGLIIEVMLWAVSVYGVAVLNLAIDKKISTAAIFSLRLAIMPVVALRLYYLSPSKSPDLPVPTILVSVYTEIAVQVAFMLASVICIKPFLQPFHPGYFITSPLPYTKSLMFASKEHNSGGISGSTTTRDDSSYHMLSAISGGGLKTKTKTKTRTPSPTNQTPSQNQITEFQEDSTATSCPCFTKPTRPTFRPTESYYTATCSAHDASRHNSVAIEPGQMAIAVRESFSVTIEDQHQQVLTPTSTREQQQPGGRKKSVAVAPMCPRLDEIAVTSPPLEIYERELGLELNGVRI